VLSERLSRDRVSFYVNVAVASDRLMPDRAGRTGPPPFSECSMWERLDHLVPDEFAESWTFHNWPDVDAVAIELEGALLEAAIPFLRNFANDDAILDYWTELLDRDAPTTPLMPLSAVVDLASAVGRTELASRAQRIIDDFSTRHADQPRLVVIQSARDS
jgi:hypothetical protein